jgi:hypothetical protein
VKFFSCLSMAKASGLQKHNFCLFLNTTSHLYHPLCVFIPATKIGVFPMRPDLMGHSVYDVTVMHSHICIFQQMSVTEVLSQSNTWITERHGWTKSFIQSNFLSVLKSVITFRLKLSASGTVSTAVRYLMLKITCQLYYSSGNHIE